MRRGRRFATSRSRWFSVLSRISAPLLRVHIAPRACPRAWLPGSTAVKLPRAQAQGSQTCMFGTAEALWRQKQDRRGLPFVGCRGPLRCVVPPNEVSAKELSGETAAERSAPSAAGAKGSASPDQLHGSACSLCILLQECILYYYISSHTHRETRCLHHSALRSTAIMAASSPLHKRRVGIAPAKQP
jgi:hypothetical protein